MDTGTRAGVGSRAGVGRRTRACGLLVGVLALTGCASEKQQFCRDAYAELREDVAKYAGNAEYVAENAMGLEDRLRLIKSFWNRGAHRTIGPDGAEVIVVEVVAIGRLYELVGLANVEQSAGQIEGCARVFVPGIAMESTVLDVSCDAIDAPGVGGSRSEPEVSISAYWPSEDGVQPDPEPPCPWSLRRG